VLVMEVGPPGSPCEGEVSNHRELLRLRAVVVSVAEKAPMMPSGVVREGERE
jgi:hypothetical protein